MAKSSKQKQESVIPNPTHTGELKHTVSGNRLRVKLTDTGVHWMTNSKLFFRKTDGEERGKVGRSAWVLLLATVRLMDEHKTTD